MMTKAGIRKFIKDNREDFVPWLRRAHFDYLDGFYLGNFYDPMKRVWRKEGLIYSVITPYYSEDNSGDEVITDNILEWKELEAYIQEFIIFITESK